jgi:hypothetical protein
MEKSPTKSPQKKILRASAEDPIEISSESAISVERHIQVGNFKCNTLHTLDLYLKIHFKEYI